MHDVSYTNGHHHHHHDGPNTSTHAASSNSSKKTKGKKPTDPNEASKLIAAKISQLELDAAGEKDQEAEIGAHTYLVHIPLVAVLWWYLRLHPDLLYYGHIHFRT